MLKLNLPAQSSERDLLNFVEGMRAMLRPSLYNTVSQIIRVKSLKVA